MSGNEKLENEKDEVLIKYIVVEEDSSFPEKKNRLWLSIRSSNKKLKRAIEGLVNYPALTDRASRFIDTLTCGILFKYSTIAEAFSSPGVSPAFHRESPSFRITKAEATSLSNVELQEGHVSSL